MCAIIGTRNYSKLQELIALNSYRGSHSYSLSFFDISTGKLTILKKDFGEPNINNIVIPDNTYVIAHVQAPTTDQKTTAAIHPAIGGEAGGDALWHNGIIKEDTIKSLVSKYNTTWDTRQILNILTEEWSGVESFNQLDGTFSCLYYRNVDKSLYIFRNEISPMFIDDDFNISSTRFENSRETIPNQIWQLNLKDNTMQSISTFTTVENPYFFGD